MRSSFRCSVWVVVVVYCLSVNLSIAQTFTKMTSLGLQAVQNGQTDWGDYDNDGDLDIILSGLQGSSIATKVYRNNGDNTVTEITGIFVGQQGESVAWLDYDRDGDLDILAEAFNASATNTVIKFYQNAGNDSFNHDKTVTFAGNNNGSMDWADYDNDGDLDLLLTGNDALVYTNDGSNNFDVQATLTTLSNSDGAWGDYDNDGDLDIVLVGNSSSNGTNAISKIYKNNGDKTFTEQTRISLQGFISGSVDWGDYNNDGYLDLAISGTDALLIPATVIYSNNTDNTFTLQATFLVNGDATVQWADMDNDGDSDLVLYNILDTALGYRLQIYTNNGNNSFTPGASVTTLAGGNGKVGDFDNDGDLDILATYTTGNSLLYINNTTTVNTAPTAPGNVQITSANGTDITLTWSKATDAQTSQNGLSYAIYLYEIGKATYVKTPEADIKGQSSNGKRRLVYRGTVQYSSTGYTFKGLPSATYAGSVQAIDAAFKGGYFATETSFAVISLKGVGIHVANNQLTNTTTLMQYSMNSTTGQDGTWTTCTTPNTTVNYGAGGFSVWVRQTSFLNNTYKVATIASAAAAPAIEIDYVNETTVQLITASMEYATQEDMRNANIGADANVVVTPGQNVFFRMRATASTVPSLTQAVTIAARPATPAYTIDFVNESTNQVVPSTDEVSTTDTMQGALAGTGSPIPITPSQTLYFQTRATSKSFKSLVQTLIVPARPAAPAYTIDFANEQTAQIVATTDDYAINADLRGAATGNNTKLTLTPGQNVYFRKRATSTSFKSAIQTLAVGARPESPVFTIDFINETTQTAVPATHEYASTLSMDGAVSGAGLKLPLTPGQTVYFRIKPTGSAFKSLPFMLTVPSRPATPAYAIDFTNETTAQIVTTADEYASSPLMTAATGGSGVKVALTPGQNRYFRTKATATSFNSLVQTLTVPARVVLQFTINYVNETSGEIIPANVQYATNASFANAAVGTGAKIPITPGQDLYFRGLATNLSFQTDMQHLAVPARVAAPPLLSIDFAGEKTNEDISSDIEYSQSANLSNATKGKDTPIALLPGTDIYLRYAATSTRFSSAIQYLSVPQRPAAPTFSIDYGNEQTAEVVSPNATYAQNATMSNAAAGTNTKIAITPGIDLYFRYAATSTYFSSAVQHMVVSGRPATPSYSINFIAETTNKNVSVADEYALNADMRMAVDGGNALVSVMPGQTLYFRTKATATGFKSLVQALVVPLRPAAPTEAAVDDDYNTFDWSYNAMYTQVNNYEFSIDNGTTWATATTKPLMIGSIDLAAGMVQVRVGAASSRFRSEPLASTVSFTKNVVTAVEKSRVDKVSFFPNPCRERLMIANTNHEKIDVWVASLSGATLIEKNDIAAFESDLDMSSLEPGMYMIVFKVNDLTRQVKLVKL